MTLNLITTLSSQRDWHLSVDPHTQMLVPLANEILPALSSDIAPRLNPIQRDLVLVVEYHPGEPISVALSRISDHYHLKLKIEEGKP